MQKGDIFPIDSKPFLSLLPGGDSVLVHFLNKSIQVKRSRWMRKKIHPIELTEIWEQCQPLKALIEMIVKHGWQEGSHQLK